MTKKIGAHLSTSGGGVPKAIERAAAIKANALQVFSGSPRMWRRTALEKIDTAAIQAARKEHGVEPIFTHALYLVNLASDKPELLEKSRKALKHDLEFDAHIQGQGVVVHLGSHQGRGWEAVKAGIVAELRTLLKQTPTHSLLLIENSAGQKGKIASDVTEIHYLLSELTEFVKAGRLGWCFDTCHSHAAGYALNPADEKGVPNQISQLDLWPTLKCIHVNDSRDDFGSGRDRHENIGEGKLSSEHLKKFLQLPQVRKVPLITEAPGFDGNGPDAENIQRLKKLVA